MIEYYPLSSLNEVLNKEDINLPVDLGYTYASIISSKEELIKFILKFTDINLWIESDIIKLVALEDEECIVDTFNVHDANTNELLYESKEYSPIGEEIEVKVLYINTLFEEDKQVLVEKILINKLKPSNISILQEYKYPILVIYYNNYLFVNIEDDSGYIHIISMSELQTNKVTII